MKRRRRKEPKNTVSVHASWRPYESIVAKCPRLYLRSYNCIVSHISVSLSCAAATLKWEPQVKKEDETDAAEEDYADRDLHTKKNKNTYRKLVVRQMS